MATKISTRPRPGTIRWGITNTIEGKFSIEFECCDDDAAFDLVKIFACGLNKGELEIKVKNEKDSDMKNMFHVFWSEEDQEWVGLSRAYPSLSYLAKTPEESIRGIIDLHRFASLDTRRK